MTSRHSAESEVNSIEKPIEPFETCPRGCDGLYSSTIFSSTTPNSPVHVLHCKPSYLLGNDLKCHAKHGSD